MKIVGIIPARKGSKGVPGKNKRIICGKMLIEHTFVHALESRRITECVVSTDCAEINKLAVEYGFKTNGIRPRNLSTDDALTVDVLRYEFGCMHELGRDDRYVLLQPTTPLRTGRDIDLCLDLLDKQGKGSVVSIVNVGGNHPKRMKVIQEGLLENYDGSEEENMMPRQSLDNVYIRNGAIYAGYTRDILDGKGIAARPSLPYIMEEVRSINIDTELDLKLAEMLLLGA